MNALIPSLTPATPMPVMQAQAQALILARQRAAQQMVSTRAAVGRFIWDDPTQAQAAFDAFKACGVKGSDLLADEKAFQAFVIARTGVAPPSLMPDGYGLTVNADGSVTVVSPVIQTGT